MQQVMNINAIRELFPMLQSYTYLNTAGCGLMPKQTAERAIKFYEDFLHTGILARDASMEHMNRVREKLAAFIGAQPQELAFAPDVATSMNNITRMFRQPVEVLLASNEFPSVALPWYAAGHNCKLVRTEEDGSVNINRIAEAITPHTKVLCISHAHFDTGYLNDIETLGKLCRERKILFLVDATQSLGAYPLDVVRQHIDIMVCSCYKWLLAGYGISLLYINENIMKEWKAPALGNNSVVFLTTSSELNLSNLRKGAGVLETGHQEFENVFRLETSFDVLTGIGFENIYPRVAKLVDHLYTRLKEKGILIHYDHLPQYRSALVMAEGDIETVNGLRRANILVSPSKGKGIRISPHFYNTNEDIDILCDELAKRKAWATAMP
jgi:selenocysteine lyase/cysteine desulfurase